MKAELKKALGPAKQQKPRRLGLLSRLRSLLGSRNPKVFCVGRNKTGTTSLRAALTILGYRIGRQRDAEALIEDWGRRDFRRLVAYCHTADAFQDVPFSHDYTFQAVDAAFPGSKFILTVRDSPEQKRRRSTTKRSTRPTTRPTTCASSTTSDIAQPISWCSTWRIRIPWSASAPSSAGRGTGSRCLD